jgi:hypothetical protein
MICLYQLQQKGSDFAPNCGKDAPNLFLLHLGAVETGDCNLRVVLRDRQEDLP